MIPFTLLMVPNETALWLFPDREGQFLNQSSAGALAPVQV